MKQNSQPIAHSDWIINLLSKLKEKQRRQAWVSKEIRLETRIWEKQARGVIRLFQENVRDLNRRGGYDISLNFPRKIERPYFPKRTKILGDIRLGEDHRLIFRFNGMPFTPAANDILPIITILSSRKRRSQRDVRLLNFVPGLTGEPKIVSATRRVFRTDELSRNNDLNDIVRLVLERELLYVNQ